MLLPTSGSGRHHVDFEPVAYDVGAAVHVRPGQVHRFDSVDRSEGWVITIAQDICPPDRFRPGEFRPVVSLGPAGPVVRALAEDLARLAELGPPGDALSTVTATLVLGHLASCHGHGPSIDEGRTGAADLVAAFRTELERSHRTERSVAWYAAEIGTSAKTLTRATTALIQMSPKELIDARVTLEAKRLLVDSDEAIAGIGHRLGFTEATNFTKYFSRTAGCSPLDFRARG